MVIKLQSRLSQQEAFVLAARRILYAQKLDQINRIAELAKLVDVDIKEAYREIADKALEYLVRKDIASQDMLKTLEKMGQPDAPKSDSQAQADVSSNA